MEAFLGTLPYLLLAVLCPLLMLFMHRGGAHGGQAPHRADGGAEPGRRVRTANDDVES